MRTYIRTYAGRFFLIFTVPTVTLFPLFLLSLLSYLQRYKKKGANASFFAIFFHFDIKMSTERLHLPYYYT